MDMSKPLDPNVPNRNVQTKSGSPEKPLPNLPAATDGLRPESATTVPSVKLPESPSRDKRPSLSGLRSFQRPIKRVQCGNKVYKIVLPLESEFGRQTNRDSYLQPEDISARMREWRQKGYDTRAFTLASGIDSSVDFIAEGQTRPIHPDPRDEHGEKFRRKYRVSIPDRHEWEAYVKHLNEEKLRALGVSEGEQAAKKSPAPSLMSRGASSQGSSMLVSPPLAPISAGGMPSLPFQALPHPNAHVSGQGQQVSHFPRFSMASPFGEKGMSSHPFGPSQSPVTGPWSPQVLGSSQPGSRVGSPAVLHSSNLGGHQSPAPPSAHYIINHAPTRDQADLLAVLRRQQQQQQQQQQQKQQQSQIQQSQTQFAKEENFSTSRPGLQPTLEQSQPQILTPVPRGHRQNPSESLQREVEEAEALLEPYGDRDENSSDRIQNAETSMSKESMQKGQQTERIKDVSISQGDDSRSLMHDQIQDQNSKAEQGRSKHSSKASFSKFNVNAPEFKFESKENGSGTSLTDPNTASTFESTSPSNANEVATQNHARKPSLVPSKFSKLNVGAPVFTPQSAPRQSTPSGEFNFSSMGASFNPDAPKFKSVESQRPSTNVPIASEKTITGMKKIFGDFKLPEVVKPARTSQALPIVNPEEAPERTNDRTKVTEDESGRITASDLRQKRARRDFDDVDQVPQFAEPRRSPWIADSNADHAAYFGSDPSTSEDERQNPLEAANDLLEEIIDDMNPSEASSLTHADKETSDLRDLDDSRTSLSAGRSKDYDETIRYVPPQKRQSVIQSFAGELDQPIETERRSARSFERRHHSSQESSFASTKSSERRISRHRGYSEDDRADKSSRNAPLRQDILDGVRYVEPSYHEIDAVMKHMNEDSDLGIERQPVPRKHSSPIRSPRQSPVPHLEEHPIRHGLLSQPQDFRSGAPSPSPNRLHEPFQYLPPTDSESADTVAREIVARNARFSPSYRPSRSDPNIRRLNSPGSTPPSDWNDAISSADEAKFHSRTAFFDNKVDDLVGDIVQRRLGPTEKQLSNIQDALTKLLTRSTSRRPRSLGKSQLENSDADDEDDEQEMGERTASRLKSPLRDRKLDQLKSSISEIATAQRKLAPTSQIAEVLDMMKDMKSAMQEVPPSNSSNIDIKNVIEEAIGRQMRGRSAPVKSSSEAAAAEKSALQIAGLESMLKVAESRAEEELNARRATEDALADNQRLLRSALQEAAEQRESAEATERSLQEYHAEQHHLLKRMATLEGSQDHLEKIASDLTEKNAALEGTLQEYRISSEKWRTDIEDGRHENKDLKRHLNSLQAENEDIVGDRQNLRSKFDHLQESIHLAAREFSQDQARWRSTEEGHKNKLEMLSARLEAEARTRERLECEIERLESQEKESMKARFQVEQTLKANAHLDKLIGQLRHEGQDHLNRASRMEQDLHAAKDMHGTELHRMRSEAKVDLEKARSEFSITRNDLRNVIARLEKQLEDASVHTETLKSRHETMLEEAAESRQRALREAAEAREAALQEHYRFHERAVEDLKTQHQYALNRAIEEQQRSETYFGNRLNLADEKVVHYEDRVNHLEEKLAIVKEAANAAVQAAQAKKSTTPAAAGTDVTSSPGAVLPEKVSPQALRESILVLQEQLQAREGHIEELETQLSEVDPDAPTKLKDANIEISWLRELLGVRIDDLEDIIKALSQPSYNREAVKDAAIRLKANLQMEQQEKERAFAGSGQTLPNLSSISNLAASPRSLPFAAAAAWGNWRRGRESTFGGLSGFANSLVQDTPSKASPPQSLFAGLMTPPSTDMRTPPQPLAGTPSRPGSSSNAKSQLGRPASSHSRQSFTSADRRRPSAQHAADKGKATQPITPPMNLLRKSSYDMDAHEGPGFDEVQEAVEPGESDGFDVGNYEVGPDETEPFGPKIGTFAN